MGNTKPYTTLSVSKAKVPVKNRKQQTNQASNPVQTLWTVKPTTKPLSSRFPWIQSEGASFSWGFCLQTSWWAWTTVPSRLWTILYSAKPTAPLSIRFSQFILNLHIRHFYVPTFFLTKYGCTISCLWFILFYLNMDMLFPVYDSYYVIWLLFTSDRCSFGYLVPLTWTMTINLNLI